jgi:hypothetical protein
MSLIPDPAFALRAAECWHLASGHLGYAWLSSGSLRTALSGCALFAHPRPAGLLQVRRCRRGAVLQLRHRARRYAGRPCDCRFRPVAHPFHVPDECRRTAGAARRPPAAADARQAAALR